MVRSLPLEIVSEFLKDVVHQQHLYTLDLTSAVYRWTDGPNGIYYLGNWYAPKGISFSEAGTTLAKQVDTLVLTIDNVDKSFSTIALTEDIRNKPCTIERVLLDKNLAVIGAPMTVFSGYIDGAEQIDRNRARIRISSQMTKWQTPTPKRLHPPTCPWIFKGPDLNCNFSGTPIQNPTSDIIGGFTPIVGSNRFVMVDDYLTDLSRCQTFSADSYNQAGYEADKAFDDDPASAWASAPNYPHWLCCQFSSAKKISSYAISVNGSFHPIKDWILQGSNDGTNWIDIEKRFGVTWPAGVLRRNVYQLSDPATYMYFRLFIQAGADAYAQIFEFELIGTSDQLNYDDYNYTTSTAAVADLFTMSPLGIADDCQVSAVMIWVAARRGQAANRNLAGRLRVSGIDYDATAIIPAQSWTYYGFSWTLNPRTGNAWQPKELTIQPDICQGGTASSDSSYGAGFEADKAFDDNTGTFWASMASALPHWIQYQLAAAKIARRYTITGYSTPSYSPTAFTFRGSNNGTDWTVIDTQSGLSWSAGEKKNFAIDNTTNYLYYRVNITAGGVSGEVAIEELEIFDADFIEGFGYSTPADGSANRLEIAICFFAPIFNATWCDYTPTRCAALANYQNFGGFEYMPELTVKEFWWGAKQKTWTGPY
jgi:hypothetical protein